MGTRRLQLQVYGDHPPSTTMYKALEYGVKYSALATLQVLAWLCKYSTMHVLAYSVHAVASQHGYRPPRWLLLTIKTRFAMCVLYLGVHTGPAKR